MRLNETAEMQKHGAWKEREAPLNILLRTKGASNGLNWERKIILTVVFSTTKFSTQFGLTEGALK